MTEIVASSTSSPPPIELEQRSGASRPVSERTSSHTQTRPDSQVPNGGYGWVVLFSLVTFTSEVLISKPVLAWWFTGIIYSWGNVQAALVKDGLSSSSTLAFVGSSTAACISESGVINARVIRHLGAKNTALLGISFVGSGQILSSFATYNVGALFVTSGAIVGIGTRYFVFHGALALYILHCLGGAVVSFAIDGLVQSVGPSWTFRILGIIALVTGLSTAWLIKERTTIRVTTFVDWSLFRDLRFIILFLADAIGTFPLFVPPFFPSPLLRFDWVLYERRPQLLLCARPARLWLRDVLAIWPVSTSLTPLVFCVVINGRGTC
ncbi:hypothetical protein DFH06DRAFT_1343040 [Mycena polygramma]|nr:hypothetical protein DFH06DRAFT_1343040 [Mycena polygramma]